jgi:acyl carrier protein
MMIDEVKAVVAKTLRIEDRAAGWTESTALFGGLPELDSMAVLELVMALEKRFGLTIDPNDVTGEVFGTLGSLAAFVESKVRGAPNG